MTRFVTLSAALFCLVVATGCAGMARRWADADVAKVLSRYDKKTLANRKEEVVKPEQVEAMPVEELPSVQHPLTLTEVLRQAVSGNRNFKTQAEGLYLSGLSLTLQQYNFGPRITNAIRAAHSDGPWYRGQITESASLGVNWILPTGGTLRTTGTARTTLARETDSAGTDLGGATENSAAWNGSIRYTQPLLAGAWYEASHEPLTQAQRNVVYAIRDFELFREDFTIDIVRAYYDLVSQKQVVVNAERNLESFRYLQERSQALFEAGKGDALDKFRAEQQELQARNNLIRQKQNLKNRLDDFKILLGLPTDMELDIALVEPIFRPIHYDMESAMTVALKNRLELQTVTDRLEDSRRKARIARQDLLPDWNVSVEHELNSLPSSSIGNSRHDRGRTTLETELVLPLDKYAERNDYRRSLIEVDRSRRQLELTRDQIRRDVRRTLRRLQVAEETVRIQDRNRNIAKERLENARLLFNAGRIPNRDFVEAQNELLEAENGYITALADYEVARLQLFRDLGIFFVNPDGTWQE